MTQIDGLTVRIDADTTKLREGFDEIGSVAETVSDTIGSAFSSAFDRAITSGESLSDVMRGLALDVSNSVLRAAMSPVGDAAASMAGNVLSGLFGAASGAVVSGGRVQPFSRGGVVNGPTVFPLRSGTGLMGEAGPEAIMPLARGPDGRLGVQAGDSSQSPVSIVVNVSTPDASSFQRSEAQIAGVMSRALARAQRTR